VTMSRSLGSDAAAPFQPPIPEGRGLSVRRDPLDRGRPIDYDLLFPGVLEASDPADNAHAAGYEAGYADGRRDAEKEARDAERAILARVERAVSALRCSTDAARTAYEDRGAEFERSAPRFAFDLLEALFGRESELATDPGRDAIARALALDETTSPAIIRLSPDDAATIGDLAHLADLAPSRSLTMIADPSVEPGGALVEIGSTTIDSQLSPALERVRAVIAGPCERDAS
jgi:flagellar assembly protein FliH